MLFRPLFFTSFMLADQLIDNAFYGATSVVMSSASSKTAYAAAFELRGQGARLVGLTSPGNVSFVESLDCYDDVVGYDDIGSLSRVPTVYLDLSGSPAIRSALQQHLGAQLARDVAVGLTNQVPNAHAATDVFFAPVQMRKRADDWGRDGLDRRFSDAWHRFVATAAGWVDIEVGQGPRALEAVWLEVLAGRSAPRAGHVIQL